MQPRGNGSWSSNRAADWCQVEISVAFPGTSVKLRTGFTREICPFHSSLGSYEAEKYAKRRKMSCKVGEDILEKYKTLEWIIVQKAVPFICVFDVCLLCRNRHPLTSLPFWSFQVKRRKIRFCDGQYLAIIHLITLFRFLRRRSTHFSRQR